MGCDIHLYREKQVNSQWVTADVWEEDDDYEGELTPKYHGKTDSPTATTNYLVC